jgi:hypothetical protein
MSDLTVYASWGRAERDVMVTPCRCGLRVESGKDVVEFILCARLAEITCVDENCRFLGEGG